MKVTVTDKGEGFITMRFEATDHIEYLILETCGMGVTETNVTLGKEYAFRSEQNVAFGSFRMPVHSMLQEPGVSDGTVPGGSAAQNAAAPGPPHGRIYGTSTK